MWKTVCEGLKENILEVYNVDRYWFTYDDICNNSIVSLQNARIQMFNELVGMLAASMEVTGRISQVFSMLDTFWAPLLDNFSSQSLFWIISNIEFKSIHNSTKMAIRAASDLGCCYSRVKGLKNSRKTWVEEMAVKCLEFTIISEHFPAWWEILVEAFVLDKKETYPLK